MCTLLYKFYRLLNRFFFFLNHSSWRKPVVQNQLKMFNAQKLYSAQNNERKSNFHRKLLIAPYLITDKAHCQQPYSF